MLRLFPSESPSPSQDESTDELPAASERSDSTEIDPTNAIPREARYSEGQRPWVYTNMITSADGGTSVDGLSGGLGTPSDRAVFSALRSVADVILVGAETARAENYRSPGPNPTFQTGRSHRGQLPSPRIAVVSGRLDLSPDLRLFDNESNRPLIFTTMEAPEEQRKSLEPRADIVSAGQTRVDLVAVINHLATLEMNTVLCEGGPSLNGQLIAADLVDEWNLSISPLLLGSDSRRAAIGQAGSGPPAGMALQRVWLGDDVLFCRWTRK